MFYQGVPIDHFTHVPDPVAQSSAESEYNSACTVGMALTLFIMINNELMKKDPDVVPEHTPLVILDGKSDVFMAKNGKYNKHTICISRRIHFVRNGEE